MVTIRPPIEQLDARGSRRPASLTTPMCDPQPLCQSGNARGAGWSRINSRFGSGNIHFVSSHQQRGESCNDRRRKL